MNILVIIHEYPPIGGGGGPIARDLSKEWVKKGHRVRVVTAKFGDLPAKEIQDGIEIIRLKSLRKESFRAKMPAMIGFVISAVSWCLFSCRDFKPDLIHVHFAVPSGPIAMIASKKFRCPYVITAHLGDIPGASPEKTGKWFQYIYPFTPPIWKKAAAVIAVSEFSKQMALKSYNVPIDVIPNGIDYQKIKNTSVEPHDKPEIVFAGRFVPQKNLIQIVETLNRCTDLNWHCTFIGDGQEKESLIERIKETGLTDRIDFPGWVSPEEVVEKFHQSDILFLPSLYEGLPVVGIQAMASGLALLMSNAGGNPEIVIQGKNGFINAPEDTEGFVRDLRFMLENPDELMKVRKNSVEIAAKFDISRTAEMYLQKFINVLNHK